MSASLREDPSGSMEGNEEIWCSVRPHLHAAAFCTVCRRRYAGRFLSVLPDGRAVCFRCVADHRLGTIERIDPDRDPAFRSGPIAAVLGVLSGGGSVFAVHYRGQIRSALFFGMTCTMIGLWAAMGWFLSSEGADAALQLVVERAEGQLTVDELRRMIPWVVPFAAAARMFFGAAIIHAMLRLLSPAEPGTLRVHARLYALSCASMLLLALPGIWGAAAANITWAFATVNWVRYLYPELSFWRVMAVVFPHILLLGMN